MFHRLAGLTPDQEREHLTTALSTLGIVADRRIGGFMGIVPSVDMAEQVRDQLDPSLRGRCRIVEVEPDLPMSINLLDQTAVRLCDGANDAQIAVAAKFVAPLRELLNNFINERMDKKARQKDIDRAFQAMANVRPDVLDDDGYDMVMQAIERAAQGLGCSISYEPV